MPWHVHTEIDAPHHYRVKSLEGWRDGSWSAAELQNECEEAVV